jgi:DNA-binding NtrC family response regulator
LSHVFIGLRLAFSLLQLKGGYRVPVTGADSAQAADRPTAISILIVDDEDATRTLCRDVATESGLRARTASTTEQATEILEQYPIDILITNLKVPELGGFELLKRVRETYPQTAVIVLTQYGTIDSAVEATRNGAADYVTKPFHVSELRTKLDRVIRSLKFARKTGFCASSCAPAPASAA